VKYVENEDKVDVPYEIEKFIKKRRNRDSSVIQRLSQRGQVVDEEECFEK